MNRSTNTFSPTLSEVEATLENYLDSLDKRKRQRLMLAIALAGYAHTGQKRKRNKALGLPAQKYIIHPIRVMLILALEAGITDIVALTASPLHDTLEDGKGRVTEEQIKRQFGAPTLKAVKNVTKKAGKLTDEEHDAYYAAIAEASLSTRLVKLADRIDNLRDALTLTDKEFQQKQLVETRKYFLEMAQATNSYLYAELLRLCDELEARLA